MNRHENSCTHRGSLGRRDAAAYLGISTRMLDNLATDGHVPRVKIGRKTLFRIVDLDSFTESRIESIGPEVQP